MAALPMLLQNRYPPALWNHGLLKTDTQLAGLEEKRRKKKKTGKTQPTHKPKSFHCAEMRRTVPGARVL
jgi:hypothetical protein